MIGMGQSISNLLAIAYDTSKYRMVFLNQTADGHYDFIANLPAGQQAGYADGNQKKQFHLIGAENRKCRDTDVLLHSPSDTKVAPGLKPNANKFSGQE